MPGRWGGEEFLVVLPGTGAEEAQAQGERVRRAIAATPVPLAEPLAVTTSVGVAAGATDGWEGLVRRADTGLYAAKEGGRDRVMAGPRPTGGPPGGRSANLHTGRPRCGKISMTGSGPARHRGTGSGWPTSR